MKTYKLRIPIGELYNFLKIDNELYDAIQQVDRKITILNPKNEYVPINAFIKKQGFVRKYEFESGNITCDENHKIKQTDGTFAFISSSDHVMVNGHANKILCHSERQYRDVYDIALDYPHEYKTSTGVESHNTSLAKLIAKNLDADILYINASDENNLETVRNKIKEFASSIGFKKWRLIILDEADGLTPASQNALRNIIETFSKHCRFILTCNYVERITEALQSRCRPCKIFPPTRAAVAKRIIEILDDNSVVYEKQTIATIINKKYPDVRSIIELCQDNVIDGKLVLDTDSIVESEYLDKIVSTIKSQADARTRFNTCRQIIADSKVSTYDELFRYLYDNVEVYSKANTQGDIIILIAEYQYKDAFVVDKEINIMALLINILRL